MSQDIKHYTIGEEIFNSISHGIGVILSLVAIPILVVQSVVNGTAWHVVATAIYGSTMFLLYLNSTLYHSLTASRAKYVFKVLDHSSIFLLIAGTYTPFLLVNLRGSWGWSMFGVIWGLAIMGIVFKAIFIGRLKILSTIVYLLMGWLVVIAIKPLLGVLSFNGFMWLLAGGLFYSIGVIFYVWRKLKFAHGIWHLFVLGGTICHFFAILFHVIPPA